MAARGADGGGTCVSEQSNKCSNKVNNDYCQTNRAPAQLKLAATLSAVGAQKGVCVKGKWDRSPVPALRG